ncbi:3-hydroxybutyrate dehydrogenase [Daejeonella sp. H1SJ63]|uniref:3-hydroxybutyrate dehydrogenase n=1 Tax=Daejeonella sp. H1SJ63 TaxID=3034145 RepID=UPI0023EA9628|nr:3-hydroxybutyrate dehydrogenase [Daejeonella sp. H1SJ63]
MKAKVVLITGSTSGIGLELAGTFARAGFNVVFHGLEPDGAKIARQFAEEFHIQTFYSSANLLVPSEIELMIADACSELGSVDVLVNNAGIQFVSPVEDFPLDKWNDILSVNLSAAFCTSKAVWTSMKDKKWGRIINIASAHGLQASEFKSAYVASKHGLIGLTKVLALEGAEFGITANAICPGYVKTPLVEKQIADLMQSHNISEQEVLQKIMLQKHAIKEFVSPDAIAALALFLASDQASMITGASLPVDGGWGAQ